MSECAPDDAFGTDVGTYEARECAACEAPSCTRRHKHKPPMNHRCRRAARACSSDSKAWGDVPSSRAHIGGQSVMKLIAK